MEKKSQITFFYLQEKLKKGVMLVTFIALSLFTGYQTCKADPLTQGDSVTFTTRQMMMEQVFDLITQQLKYDIFYSENELNIRKMVQMPQLKMKLTDVLNQPIRVILFKSEALLQIKIRCHSPGLPFSSKGQQ